MNSVPSVTPCLRAWRITQRRTSLGCAPTARCHCLHPPSWTNRDLGCDRPRSATRHFLEDGGRGSREWVLSSRCTLAWISPIKDFSLCNSWRIMSSLRRLVAYDTLVAATVERPLRLCPTVTLESGLCPFFWVMPELCPAPSS